MQVRTTSTSAEAIAAYGATPSSMEISEVYEALRSGLVDGCYTMFGAGAVLALQEVGSYALITPFYSTVYTYCMNKDTWNSMANWEGYEELRQMLLARVPHFGNNAPHADKWMTWATEAYYGICQEMSSKYAKYYRAGLYGAADHVGQGYTTWATPDGRKAGTPIADSASPAQSRDVCGPTAVLNSSCCYDHGKFMDGVCLNMRIHPSALSREDGCRKLSSMILTYMDQGGAEVQFNVVSAEMMRAAQKTPDEYRDLVVRIAGYSAYFVELSTDCQNDLIARNENMI